MADNEGKNKNNDSLEERLRDPSQVRSAFGELIDRYTEPLYWQIRRLVTDHDDANDILQNTFMKAWSNIENFRGEAKLGTWLHKIAINESLSFLEKEKRRTAVGLDSGEAGAVPADEYFDGDELAANLRRAVDALPEKQKLIFNMKYFDDMKYEQISEILGTTVGALKASYHAATKKIEQFFKDLG